MGDYYRLRVYDNNVWADKQGHLDWARTVVVAETAGSRMFICSRGAFCVRAGGAHGASLVTSLKFSDY